MSVVYFLVLVGVLVVIHELGHFFAAKLLNFKVIRFSIGFGQPLLRFRGPETEYQLALFPLGGYVRILGEDPDDDIPEELAARAFSAKPLWQRLIVVFAGPFANFCLPIAIYFASFAGDTELPAAVIGDVVRETPADLAGLLPGDQILSIDGTSTRYWHDVEQTVHSSIGKELRIIVLRNNREVERFVTPVEYRRPQSDTPGSRHGIIGITQAPFLPQVGIVNPNSPAALAGMKTGDLILSIDGVSLYTWQELRAVLRKQPSRMSVIYVRGNKNSALGVTQHFPLHAEVISRNGFGFAPAEMIISAVADNSPAQAAGLREGDLLRTLDGREIHHWMVLQQLLQGHPTRTWKLGWQRAVRGKVVTMHGLVTPRLRTEQDEYGHKSQVLFFGATSEFERGRATMVSIDGPIRYAASRAIDHGFEAIAVMASSFVSVLHGQSPSDELGGPIMMFRVASVSGSKGWESLFLLIALVSISVGLINLLPIPVLDGGHLLLFTIEAIRGKPLDLQTLERINLIGLAAVAIITILALRNDVVRYIL